MGNIDLNNKHKTLHLKYKEKYRQVEEKEGNCYPGIRQAIWLLVLIFLLQTALVILAGILGSVVDFPLTEHPVTIGVINLIAIGLVLMLGLKKTNAPFKEVFPLSTIKISLLFPISLTVIGMGILISEVDNLFRTVLPMPTWISDLFMNLLGHWSSIILLVIIAPLTEEPLFRGLILRGFLGRYTVRKAVLVSAILFGLLHFNPWQFIGAVILGVLFAWWFVQTGSLLPCLFGHALHNAVPLILMGIFHLEIQGLTSATTAVEFQPLWLDLVGLLLTWLGMWLLIRMFRETETTPSEDSFRTQSQ